MKKNKNTRRATLSFDKSELFKLDMAMAGIQLGSNPKDFRPDKAVDLFAHEQFLEIMQMGMFGDGNNANTFYPGVSVPKDVMPKPEDFIDVPFRLLSATTVGAGSWKATDFSDVNMLRASKDKLLAKPIYFNHDTSVLNWVGGIKSVKWSDAFTNGDGIKVPAGIDGMMSIDAKSNPKIARGVLTGNVFSNSVTVVFNWEPSHKFDSEHQFMDRIGEMGDDGKMIRRIVTSIEDYYESSLVWLGADPFAKLIDPAGNLKNIDLAGISYSKISGDIKKAYDEKHEYRVFFGFEKDLLHLSKRNEKTTLNNNIMNDKILAQLAVLLGVEVSTLTVESLSKLSLANPADVTVNAENATLATSLKTAITEFSAANPTVDVKDTAAFLAAHKFVPATQVAEFANAQTELVTLRKEKTDLTTEVTSLKADATLGQSFIKMKRDETVRLYKVAQGDKATDAVVALINEAKPEALEGLLAQYAGDATGKFASTCTDCGSNKIEFRSSVADKDLGAGATAALSNEDDGDFDAIVRAHSNDSMSIKLNGSEEVAK